MKKILHIIGNLDIGGAEIDLIAKTLALRNKYQFTVLTLLARGALADQLLSEGVNVVSGNIRKKFDLAAALKIRRIVAGWKPDIVHAHMFPAYLVAHFLRITGVVDRVVYTIQKEADRAGRLELFAERLLRPYSAKILVSSNLVGESYAINRVEGDNIVTVHNSVDLSKFARGKNLVRDELGIESGPVIGMVGRLLSVKGHAFFVAALPKILESYPNVRCVIIGDGDARQSLIELAAKLGVTRAIYWLGYRSDTENFVPYFDIFVMPSLSEAFGIAAAEASACGIPVVASDVGGLREVVLHGKTGYLVLSANSLAISEHIIRLLDSKDLRRNLGRAGKKHVQQFGVDSLAKKLDSIYESVLLAS
ncbi:MAG: glycosyltransferase [Chloroflexi bacterium]|nr:glycosyltransferase [Chloroflexota bacterium]